MFWESGITENHGGMWMDVKMNKTYEMYKNHYSKNLSEKVLYQKYSSLMKQKLFFIFWLMNKNITSNSTWITFCFYINCKRNIACKTIQTENKRHIITVSKPEKCVGFLSN